MPKAGFFDRKSITILKLVLLLLVNCAFIYWYRDTDGALALFILLIAMVCWGSISVFRAKDLKKQRKSGDFTTIFLVLIFVWGYLIQHLEIADTVLYPSPMRVMDIMVEEFPRYLDNLVFSLGLLAEGFVIALCTGFPLGLLLACNQRVRLACSSYTKILSLIPSLAFLPYAIAAAPTFRAASIFVIFYSMFWTILNWTIRGVATFDPNYILTARLLGIPKTRYLFRVLIPGIMPSVLSGVSGCISGGFVVLIAAEMLGSSRGLGYFIKYFSMFLNYHKIIVGIIYLGISVCAVTWLYEKLQARILSWQVNERKRRFESFRKIRASK